MITHSRPMIDEEDIKAVTEVLASGMIAQGRKVKEFEEAIAHFVGTRYAVAVSSGTSALHLALLSLHVGVGDEVIIPSYVCTSPYFAIVHAGATPKIVDVDLKNLNINANHVKEAISAKTKAVIVPHMFGNPAELGELLDLGVPVIEDCAQSLGARYKEMEVGSYGDLSVFSFYATKMITTGEGGMILTDEREVFERVMQLRDYDKKELTPPKFNCKMTDFQAALGLSQLNKLPRFIQRRKEIASIYTESFSSCSCKMLDSTPESSPAFFRYILMLDNSTLIQQKTKQKGVVCEKPVHMPIHKYFSLGSCPNSDIAYDRALSVPLYPSLAEEEVEYVVTTMREILNNR
jgi:perosamine synthetase